MKARVYISVLTGPEQVKPSVSTDTNHVFPYVNSRDSLDTFTRENTCIKIKIEVPCFILCYCVKWCVRARACVCVSACMWACVHACVRVSECKCV